MKIEIKYIPSIDCEILKVDGKDIRSDDEYIRIKEYIEDEKDLFNWINRNDDEDWNGLINELTMEDRHDEIEFDFTGFESDYKRLIDICKDLNKEREVPVTLKFNLIKKLDDCDDKNISNNLQIIEELLQDDELLGYINKMDSNEVIKNHIKSILTDGKLTFIELIQLNTIIPYIYDSLKKDYDEVWKGISFIFENEEIDFDSYSPEKLSLYINELYENGLKKIDDYAKQDQSYELIKDRINRALFYIDMINKTSIASLYDKYFKEIIHNVQMAQQYKMSIIVGGGFKVIEIDNEPKGFAFLPSDYIYPLCDSVNTYIGSLFDEIKTCLQYNNVTIYKDSWQIVEIFQGYEIDNNECIELLDQIKNTEFNMQIIQNYIIDKEAVFLDFCRSVDEDEVCYDSFKLFSLLSGYMDKVVITCLSMIKTAINNFIEQSNYFHNLECLCVKIRNSMGCLSSANKSSIQTRKNDNINDLNNNIEKVKDMTSEINSIYNLKIELEQIINGFNSILSIIGE